MSKSPLNIIVLTTLLILVILTVTSVAHQKPSQKVVQALESRLFEMFGLRTRPRPKRDLQIPQYMLELYKYQTQSNTINVNSDIDEEANAANTVTSYNHIDSLSDPRYGENTHRLKFNMTGLPAQEELSDAKMRLYVQGLPQQRTNKVRVEVYDILKPARRNHQEPILLLIDTKVMDVRRTRWESFDIYPAVVRWSRHPKRNHGLVVRVVSVNNTKDDGTGASVRVRRDAAFQDVSTWETSKPQLIVFSNDKRFGTPRSRRSPERRHRRKHMRDSCRRLPLYVDFNDVGWNDWIVAPPGYDAYYCQGDCPFPLADHLNATNHAIVQTLVNSVNPNAVPRACCVPTELSSISMLYVDEYEKVVLKNYQDMVVEGCGCR